MAAAVPMWATTCHLRQSVVADERFLLELYAQTRGEELMHSGMDPLQREIFVQMQFRIRQMGYRKTYPMAIDEIICTDHGISVGRVLTDRGPDEMCLIDIAIVAEMQNQEFGTRVIQELQQECAVLEYEAAGAEGKRCGKALSAA